MSLSAYLLLQIVTPDRVLPYTAEMLDAAGIMQRALAVTRAYCDTSGIRIDSTVDPNRTGLIGPEHSGLMTTLGHLDAKRTTTDPTMASLIVHLLDQAGVSSGDTIAIGSSGSFPALLVASLAAAKAIKAHPVAIISLGASSYGATNEEFDLLDMYDLLVREGILDTLPVAVSLGGERDIGEGFEPELRERLAGQIEASGSQFIREPDLRRNVVLRMNVYDGEGRENRIAAFIHSGGSYANLGTSPLALELNPGLNTALSIPPESQRGVLFEMAARGVPIIHLLYIRGLALRYGLLWDPVPLSQPGQVHLSSDLPENRTAVWMIGVPFFLTLLAIAVYCATAVRWNTSLRASAQRVGGSGSAQRRPNRPTVDCRAHSPYHTGRPPDQ